MSRTVAALALATALAVAGCGSTASPSPTPGSIDDVIAAIVLQDVTVLHLTSGDAGCASSSLHSNAVHLVLAIGTQSMSHDVYLLRWRKQADFDAAASTFEECVQEYARMHPGQQLGSTEMTPWRAYGPFWTDQLQRILANAFLGAGGG